ncbi:hypothetical protein GCM10009764_60040 [Nocardia ninae]|uniref:Uncharacterized protein n=1 Tax=Nocardia ninae NBRC 108245 TaxID=1210091 RepID=A0A511MKM0_9NOCA|nr:hypothetical protein NN4_55100 [Nocardia ninae NBRC 108245]
MRAQNRPASVLETASMLAKSRDGWRSRRPRLVEIRDNLTARVTEAEKAGWIGEVEGLRVSLAAAQDKLNQLDQRPRRATTVDLRLPSFPDMSAPHCPASRLQPRPVASPTGRQPAHGIDRSRTALAGSMTSGSQSELSS